MTVKISMAAAGIMMAGSVGRQTIGSLGSSEDSTNGSLKKPTFSERHPKVVRSLTVVAYIFSVSLAAIVLSAYYVVLWSPQRVEAKSTIVVNSTLPCRGKVEMVQVDGHTVPVSRLTYSGLRQVVYLPIVGTPPPQPPAIPVPNKLVSNNNSNSSLQEEESSTDVSSNSSGKQQQPFVLDEGSKHVTTTVPSSSSTSGAIIVTKIIHGKPITRRRGRT